MAGASGRLDPVLNALRPYPRRAFTLSVTNLTRVARPLNEFQLSVLARVARGAPFDDVTNPQKLSARAMSGRHLVKVSGRGSTWRASLTELGEYYLEHKAFPEPVVPTPPAPEPLPAPTKRGRGVEREPDWEVDSPRGKRESGRRLQSDSLFSPQAPDPWDEKVLVSVKEAAWMLSLPEGAIRHAVLDGDLDRVFIGTGTKNYRVVYGSLLAWVNSMPRDPAPRSWWSYR